MEDTDAAGRLADTHVAAGVVHAVGDVAVLQVITELIDRRLGAVDLGFLCRRAQVRGRDAAAFAGDCGVGEIRHIAADPALVQGLDNSLFIDQEVAGHIDEDNA